jgi:hypothetical protein
MNRTNFDPEDEMRTSFERSDLGAFTRGKYVGKTLQNSITVTIHPELSKLFPDAASVNKALQTFAELMRLNPQLYATI